MRKCSINGPGSGVTGIEAQRRLTWNCERCAAFRTSLLSCIDNVRSARMLATRLGWNLQDLLNTSTYYSLHRNYNACLETVSHSGKRRPFISENHYNGGIDVRFLFNMIDAEIFSQRENKERRQKAHARQTRRADISRHYDRIVAGKGHPIVPVLAEFRRLPIIKALQDRDDAPPVSDTTHSSSAKSAKSSRVLDSQLEHSELIGGMINNDLKKWVDTALAAFNSILGQPNWKLASTKFLHPAERVTARFICTMCSKRSKKGATAESLTFRQACAHWCVRFPKKAATKQVWKADQFAPDKKVYVRFEGRKATQS
jgi:hypothetical protein